MARPWHRVLPSLPILRDWDKCLRKDKREAANVTHAQTTGNDLMHDHLVIHAANEGRPEANGN